MNAKNTTIGSASAPNPRRWIGFMVILSATLLSVLDFLIVNIALPTIQTSLGASDSELQFTVAGYGLAFAVFLITGGRLGDIYGRRRIFQIGMFIFTAASAFCGFAQNPAQLILFRVVQGLFAALMTPQVLATVQVAFSDRERDKATGIIGATVGVGAFLGNVVGGFLIAANLFGLGWRAIFFVNVPIGIAAIILSFFFVPESKSALAKKLDIPGAILSAVALFLLIFPIAQGRENNFPLWTFIMLAGSVVVFLLFLRYQRWLANRGGSPLIDIELFQSDGYRRGLSGILLLFSGMSSFSLTLTLFMQKAMGVPPQMVGVIFSALSISFLTASLSTVRLMSYIGNKTLLCGLIMMQLGQITFIVVPLLTRGSLDPYWFVPLIFLYGCGEGLCVPQIIRQTLNEVGVDNAGAASGLLNTVQQIAFSLGVAVVGSIFFAFAENGETAESYSDGLAAAFACNFVLVLLTGFLMARNFRRSTALDSSANTVSIVEA